MADDGEEPLAGGRMTRGVVRRSERVLRPLGPWSEAVHEYLRHLESVDFPGAPRVLSVEGDREIVTYLDGEVAADPSWQPGRGHRLPAHARSDEALIGAGRLIRDLPSRLRLFVDAYGLPDGPAILPALQRSILTSSERIATWPLSPAEAAASLEYLAGELRWLHTVTPALERALAPAGPC